MSLKQKESLLEAGPPLLGPDGVDETTRDRLRGFDEEIRFLCYSIWESLSELISNNLLYGLRDEWPTLEKYLFQKGRLPLVFAALLDSVCKALDIVRPRPPQLEVTKPDEDGRVVMRSGSQPPLSLSYRNVSLLISAPGWAEPKLDTNCQLSGNKSTTLVQTTLKKRQRMEAPV